MRLHAITKTFFAIAAFASATILASPAPISSPSPTVSVTGWTTVIKSAATPSTTDSSLGINCRGSTECGLVAGDILDMIAYVSNGTDPGRVYYNGDQIACRQNLYNAGICTFFQNIPGDVGATQDQVLPLLQDLYNHGCNVCGSVPITYPGSNSPKNGILTVNYVSSADCNGLC